MRASRPILALVLGWATVAFAAPFAYIPNSGTNDVTVIDTATDTVVTTITGVGTSPETAVVSPNGKKIYVGNTGSFSVVVIDAKTNTVTKTISVLGGVLTLARNPAGTRLLGAGGSFVKAVNASARRLVRERFLLEEDAQRQIEAASKSNILVP